MKHRRTMTKITTVLIVSASATTAVASSHGTVETAVSFDAASAELPEGVALDKSGNTYVSLGPPFFFGPVYGAIEQIRPDGSRTTVVELPDGPAPAGLAVSPAGTVYFALPNLGQPDSGVYRITDDGAEQLPASGPMLVPNGLALDKRGDLYASDSILGEIWRFPRNGDAGTTWVVDELLAPCPDEPGVNGIAFWRGDLYTANTARGLLAKIPVNPDGTPGDAIVVAGDADCDPTDELYSIDGIAFDVHGQVYAALVLTNQLVRIDPSDGTVEQLLDEDDGLWNPASLAFGTGRGDRQSVFITNYAVLPPVPAANLGPALLEFDVGTPGLPLP